MRPDNVHYLTYGQGRRPGETTEIIPKRATVLSSVAPMPSFPCFTTSDAEQHYCPQSCQRTTYVNGVRVGVTKVSMLQMFPVVSILTFLSKHVHIGRLLKVMLHNEYSIINVFHQLVKREGIT